MRDLIPWLRLILQQRHRLWFGGLLMLATLAAGIGLLGLSGWFITATALTGLLLTAGVSVAFDVYVPGGGIRFFALTRTVSRYYERLYNHDTVLRMLARIRVRFFEQLAGSPASRRPARRSAHWLNRLTSDIESLDNLYLRLLAPAALALLSTLMVGLLMALVAPTLLWSMLPLALLPLILVRLARRNLLLTSSLGEQLQTLRGDLVDVMEGHRELAAALLWKQQTDLLVDSGQHQNRLTLAAEKETADAQALLQAATQMSIFVALIIGLGLWQDDALSGPVALMFALALFGLAEAFINLPAAFAQTGRTLGAARRLNQDTSGAASSGPAAVSTQNPDPSATKATLRLESVTRYINGEALFAPLNLTLQPGEHLGIVGPSGCGKSSILDMIAGLVAPDDGTITVEGHSLSTTSPKQWLTGISYLQQSPWLFDTTVEQYLRLADPTADDGRLWSVLHAVDLDELVASLFDGLASPLGDQAGLLSGGERRRLALAQTLLKPAPLVLLDEPFTGLDGETAARVREGIRPWLASRTCVMVAHGEHALPPADRVMVLG